MDNFTSLDPEINSKSSKETFEYIQNLNNLDPEINSEVINEAETISLAYEAIKSFLPTEVLSYKIINI